jgi:hypothetical protein
VQVLLLTLLVVKGRSSSWEGQAAAVLLPTSGANGALLRCWSSCHQHQHQQQQQQQWGQRQRDRRHGRQTGRWAAVPLQLVVVVGLLVV